MRIAIITVAGMSSRFNAGIPEGERKLKAIYTEGDRKCTLLYHLLEKCAFADRIIVVGGYKFGDLKAYCDGLEPGLSERIVLVFNDHYEDLASGYSLFLGLREAFQYDPGEILFLEGDLDIGGESFDRILASHSSVLSYNAEPIYANKAVVLYRDEEGRYRYAFNSRHGLLSIDSAFSCILNSGQVWKFTEMGALRRACEKFYAETRDDTNLRIIQNYLDQGTKVELVGFQRWTNCNTREDYRTIVSYWEEER